jgi:methylthioribose-1-phosphate isomerase
LLTVAWKDNSVVLIDQTKLPNKLVYVTCKNYNEVADVIRRLVVRGAPAIGVSAAFGLALAAQQSKAKTLPELIRDLDSAFRMEIKCLLTVTPVRLLPLHMVLPLES